MTRLRPAGEAEFIQPSVRVVILHNDACRDEWPNLSQVYECVTWATYLHPVVLEDCWEEFNIGEASVVAQEYRARRLRSLSKGDIVVIGNLAYRCESVGWSRPFELPVATLSST